MMVEDKTHTRHSPRALNDAAVYGFVGWIGTFVGYVLFIVWAYVPESILHELGITYYPDKSWALRLPVYLCVCFVLLQVAYLGLNMWSTAPLDSFETITDHWSQEAHAATSTSSVGGTGAPSPSPPRLGSSCQPVPNFADLDIGEVNQLLYSQTATKRESARRRSSCPPQERGGSSPPSSSPGDISRPSAAPDAAWPLNVEQQSDGGHLALSSLDSYGGDAAASGGYARARDEAHVEVSHLDVG